MQESIISIIDTLNFYEVDYCLIGGLAVAIHGIPRFTDDIDFLVHNNIVNVFSEMKGTIKSKGGTANYIKADLNDPLGDVIQLNLLDNQIDLISAKTSLDFSALTRATKEKFQDITIRVVSVEDLILLKLNAGGPQDLYDVAGIINVSSEKIDLNYLTMNINNEYIKNKWSLAKSIADKNT